MEASEATPALCSCIYVPPNDPEAPPCGKPVPERSPDELCPIHRKAELNRKRQARWRQRNPGKKRFQKSIDRRSKRIAGDVVDFLSRVNPDSFKPDFNIVKPGPSFRKSIRRRFKQDARAEQQIACGQLSDGRFTFIYFQSNHEKADLLCVDSHKALAYKVLDMMVPPVPPEELDINDAYITITSVVVLRSEILPLSENLRPRFDYFLPKDSPVTQVVDLIIKTIEIPLANFVVFPTPHLPGSPQRMIAFYELRLGDDGILMDYHIV